MHIHAIWGSLDADPKMFNCDMVLYFLKTGSTKRENAPSREIFLQRE